MDKTAVELFDMKVKHVGVNASGDEEAAVWAKEFLELLGLGTRDAGASYFCGELVEIMKHNGRGAKGHIAFPSMTVRRPLNISRSVDLRPSRRRSSTTRTERLNSSISTVRSPALPSIW